MIYQVSSETNQVICDFSYTQETKIVSWTYQLLNIIKHRFPFCCELRFYVVGNQICLWLIYEMLIKRQERYLRGSKYLMLKCGSSVSDS